MLNVDILETAEWYNIPMSISLYDCAIACLCYT